MKKWQSSLPESFLTNMKKILGGEYETFLESYNQPTRRGLRFNLLKPHNQNISDLIQVPWCASGYEYPQDTRPSKSLLYNAGLFYIQEPSAMLPATVLCPKPGERVLDICAAPGGKSVQLAGFMQGEGLLVSNDASPSRCRSLIKNLEMAGVTNAAVLTELPHRLAPRFNSFFDCILVDAPCSGEGMFRRDPDAAKAYTSNKPDACAQLQRDILHHSAKMLKPGGRIVYSTCTFNSLENEGTVAAFLQAHPNFKQIPIEHENLKVSPGLDGISARIWPHKSPGEGHFVALMIKTDDDDKKNTIKFGDDKGKRHPAEFQDFCKEALYISDFNIEVCGGRLYHKTDSLDLSGLRVVRSGWLLGEISKGRFIPSQALAMGIKKPQARHFVELCESEAIRYLRGESLMPSDDFILPPGKPWILVCYHGHPLGWARLVQERLKNQLPTGWVTDTNFK